MMWEGEDDVESDLRTCIPTGPHRSPMSYTRVMGGERCGLSGEDITRNVLPSFDLTIDAFGSHTAHHRQPQKGNSTTLGFYLQGHPHPRDPWHILDEVYNPSWSFADNLERTTIELRTSLSRLQTKDCAGFTSKRETVLCNVGYLRYYVYLCKKQ